MYFERDVTFPRERERKKNEILALDFGWRGGERTSTFFLVWIGRANMMLRRAGALGAGRAAMRGVQRARVRRRQAMEAVRCQSFSHSTTSPRSTADDGQMTKAERRREEILRNEVEVVTNATSASCLPEDWNAKVLLVDKPLDWTSFDVCGKLRRLVRVSLLQPQSSKQCTNDRTRPID